MKTPRRFRPYRRPMRRTSSASQALTQARASARLSAADVARALRVHPKTIRRWERGESRPHEPQWPKLFAFYAQRSPTIAATLAASTGRALPTPPPPSTLHPRMATLVMALAADALDVAPRRVLDVLRATVHAAEASRIPIDLLMKSLPDLVHPDP